MFHPCDVVDETSIHVSQAEKRSQLCLIGGWLGLTEGLDVRLIDLNLSLFHHVDGVFYLFVEKMALIELERDAGVRQGL